MNEPRDLPASNANPERYESPEVERVMDAEELGREVHYAGDPIVVVPISDFTDLAGEIQNP